MLFMIGWDDNKQPIADTIIHCCRPSCDKVTGKVQQHIQFDAATINEFEFKLQK